MTFGAEVMDRTPTTMRQISVAVLLYEGGRGIPKEINVGDFDLMFHFRDLYTVCGYLHGSRFSDPAQGNPYDLR